MRSAVYKLKSKREWISKQAAKVQCLFTFIKEKGKDQSISGFDS